MKLCSLVGKHINTFKIIIKYHCSFAQNTPPHFWRYLIATLKKFTEFSKMTKCAKKLFHNQNFSSKETAKSHFFGFLNNHCPSLLIPYPSPFTYRHISLMLPMWYLYFFCKLDHCVFNNFYPKNSRLAQKFRRICLAFCENFTQIYYFIFVNLK